MILLLLLLIGSKGLVLSSIKIIMMASKVQRKFALNIAILILMIGVVLHC